MSDSPAAEMSLGSLAVAVDGNIEPLIAKLAEARRIADEFDQHMAKGSAGLIRFNETARATGAATADMATKTASAGTSAADAATNVNKLSDANERATRTSRAAADAAETEAQKNERLAAMVDRASARLQERNNLLTTNAGRSLSGITSAGIPADYVANPLIQDAMMGTAGGKIPEAALAGTAGAGLAVDAKAVAAGTKAVKEETEAVEVLGKSTKISSLSIREMIVLMREMGRGDFTRMAGSATLLGQSFGVIEKLGATAIFSVLGLAAAVGTFGYAAVEGSKEANELGNVLLLTGGKAGFSAASFDDASEKIADLTKTSVGSNRELMRSLTETNDFSKEQIEALVTAAQLLSRATGQAADDIEKDFAKMAADPVKYAEAFQHAHTDIISPVQMAHLRELEQRGEKEQALADLIKIVTDGIAKNTVDNISTMQAAWNGFINAVRNGWAELKDALSGGNQMGQIGNLTAQIHNMESQMQRGTFDPREEDRYKRLVNERSALQESVNAEEASAKARRGSAEAADRQNAAINRVNDTYQRGIDSTGRYTDHVKQLNNTLADAVRLSRDAPIATILSAASKSADQGVRDLGAHYEEAVNRIKRQDLPVQFKADAKAAREAASEAKKLANEAEALERRRQGAISAQSDEAATLEAVLKLYQDHAASLEDVNRAKAITTALTRVKLTADSEEGRQLAELVGHVYDLNKAIADETNERKILDSMRDKTDSLQIEAELIGKSGWALAFEEEKLRALSQAMKDHIPITDEFMAAIAAGARKVADATVAADAAKFFDTIDKNIRSIELEARTVGQSANSVDYATIRLRLLNDAKAKHIELTEENIRKIDEEAGRQLQAQEVLNNRQRREDFSPTSPYEVKPGDFGALDQQLGGKFKKSDDLRLLQQDLNRQRAIVKQYHADGLIDEKGYQERLNQIEQDGAAKRHEIELQTINLQLSAAESTWGSLAQMARDGFGEQSKAYRAFFDVQKVFAIASAALAMEQDIAQAMSKGFPQNIPLIAQAAAQGAMIISDIRSIALTFQAGGYVAGPGTGTSDSVPAYLSNGEFVTNAQATSQWRPVLEAINSGRMPALSAIGNAANDRAPRISIHNHAPGVSHEARVLSTGEVEIIARRQVESHAPGVVAADLANPNSRTSKAVSRHTKAGRNRS